ncbi:MAG: ABC transporter permease subunit [Actinomycetota bacterium]|nr:ABC transporter permease subunit [Actinomycetota bacterium]
MIAVIWTLARSTFVEAKRRRIFLVVPIVTFAFLVLYTLGVIFAFHFTRGSIAQQSGRFVDSRAFAGATLVGLSMFATLFLGTVLGVFLTFSAVRGDAEQGVLQAFVVRPIGRSSVLLGRFVGASIAAGGYVVFLYAVAVAITGVVGGWWPSDLWGPAVSLVGAVVVTITLSLLGSVFMATIANGVTVLMLYGAGLLGGLLGQIGYGLNSHALQTAGKVATWALPFEAAYQAGLNALTSGTSGLTRVIVRLGPLGGAESGGYKLVAWVVGYVLLLGVAALVMFERRDL